MTPDEKRAAIAAVPYWFHTIDLGDGVVTPGAKSGAQLAAELEALALPALGDKSVLDVGAWDGFFSFAAERRGARQVVALDHFVWSLDLPKTMQFGLACDATGRVRPPFHRVPGLAAPGTLPGKRGFDTAHALLGSHVEQVVADFMTVDPLAIGSFDVVLFLGVLYHLENPLAALRRLALLTREVAIIETASITVPGREDAALFEFYGANELANDTSNWWAPNLAGLTAMCHAAGFRRVESTRAPTAATAHEGPLVRDRLTIHAWR